MIRKHIPKGMLLRYKIVTGHDDRLNDPKLTSLDYRFFKIDYDKRNIKARQANGPVIIDSRVRLANRRMTTHTRVKMALVGCLLGVVAIFAGIAYIGSDLNGPWTLVALFAAFSLLIFTIYGAFSISHDQIIFDQVGKQIEFVQVAAFVNGHDVVTVSDFQMAKSNYERFEDWGHWHIEFGQPDDATLEDTKTMTESRLI